MQVVIDLIKAAGESQSALVLVLLLLAAALFALAYVARMFVFELRGSIAGHRSDMAQMLGEMLTEQRTQNAELRAQSAANTTAVLAANEGMRACTDVIQKLVELLQRESRHHPAPVLPALDSLHPKVDEMVSLARVTGTRVMEIAEEISSMREDLARMERDNIASGVRPLRGGIGA